MSKTIEIRNLSDAAHERLTARAASAGMTLPDYVRDELENVARQHSLEDLAIRVQAMGGRTPSREEIQQAIDESREERANQLLEPMRQPAE